MTATVITVTSGKGGVGKTTTAANIGVALATLGKKVVCVDADIGLRNLDVVMGLENRIVYDLVDVVEGRARLRQAMIKDKRLKDELYMIPAAQTRDKTAVSPTDMIRLCDELRTLVDYVLIDSPAGIERGFRNAIAPADRVLIVTNPEVSSVRDADRIIGLIEAEDKGPGQLIINRVKPEMVKRGDMLSPEDIIDILAIELIGLIPEDENILVSTNRGTPVALNTEDSLSGRAYRNIARRIMGQEVPFLPLDDEPSWLQRILRKVGVAENPLPPEEPLPAASGNISKPAAEVSAAVVTTTSSAAADTENADTSTEATAADSSEGEADEESTVEAASEDDKQKKSEPIAELASEDTNMTGNGDKKSGSQRNKDTDSTETKDATGDEKDQTLKKATGTDKAAGDAKPTGKDKEKDSPSAEDEDESDVTEEKKAASSPKN